MDWRPIPSGATRLLTNHDLTNGSVELTDDIANYEYFDVVVQHSNGQQYTVRLKRDQLDPYAAVSRTISGLYTIDGQTLYSIDKTDASATAALKLSGDPIHADSNYRDNAGLAYGDGAFWLYAVPSGSTRDTGHIFKIDAATGTVTDLGDLGLSNVNVGLEYAGSTLYMYHVSNTGDTGRLSTINQTTGARTQLGTSQTAVLPGIGLAYTGTTMYLYGSVTYLTTSRRLARWNLNLSNGAISSRSDINEFASPGQTLHIGAAYDGAEYLTLRHTPAVYGWILNTGAGVNLGNLPFGHGIGGLAAGSATVQANAETDLSRFVRYDPANSGRQLAVFTDMDNTDHLYIYAGTGSDAPESISVYGVANI